MTSVTVWTLYPGVCEPILCRRGHHLHIEHNLKMEEAVYLNKFAIKHNLDFYEKSLSPASFIFCLSTTQYINTLTLLMCHEQLFVSLCDLSKCCFRPSLAGTHGCQVFCSLRTHHATNVAPHTGTTLCLNQLPPAYQNWRKPNITTYQLTWRGGGEGGYTAKHSTTQYKTAKHFLIM
jgi:hypothetical protein